MGLVDYVRDTKGELKHVSWPTKKQSVVFTVIVVAISVVVAAYLGFFDFIFSLAIEKLVL
jgi:preprotein translocase subunit SecE